MEDHILLKLFLYIVLFIVPMFGCITIFNKITGKEKSGFYGLFFIVAILLSYWGTPYLIKNVFYKTEFIAKEKYSNLVPKIERIVRNNDLSYIDTSKLMGAIVIFSNDSNHYSLDAYHTGKLPAKLLPGKDNLPQYVIIYSRSQSQVGQWHGARNDAVYHYYYSFQLYDLKKDNNSVYAESGNESSGSDFPNDIYCRVLSQITDTVSCGSTTIIKY
jgi:hypothetical protein